MVSHCADVVEVGSGFSTLPGEKKLATGIAVMSMLPFELIVEIISWLPVKSQLRFKCTNKTWNSVISDPEFAKLQLSRSTDCHKLLLTTTPPQSIDYEALQIRNLNYPAMLARHDNEKDYHCTIIGSCNGLVCLCKNKRMFLWNPTTGNCTQIPDPSAFQDVFLQGMAYNRSTGDHGVICVSGVAANRTLIEIYSLKTRSWKRIEESGSGFSKSIVEGSEFTCNGDLYCLSIKGGFHSVICLIWLKRSLRRFCHCQMFRIVV